MKARRGALAGAAALCLVAAPSAPVAALPGGVEVENYLAKANFPVDMAWDRASGRVFFTEKNTGKVRVMVDGRLKSTACVDLEVSRRGERGALGIALDPDFERNAQLYVYYTNKEPLENRVTRFTVRNDRCVGGKDIVTGLKTYDSSIHNGGQLEFVGDKLFVSVGESDEPALAQNVGSRHGKILRYETTGRVPDGNPFSTPSEPNPVWSYGHRNPFGLVRKPGTKKLYATENGPDCDDEFNTIRPGRNYGWGPGYRCGTNGVGVRPKKPMLRWSRVIGPTNAIWYRGPSVRSGIYMGDFVDGALHRIILNRRGTRVVSNKVIFRRGWGVIGVAKGPGKWLYVLTPTAIKRLVTP